ncbi:MAG: hypothetical protein ABIH47_08300 [Candidatus Omnitrophota bacterium]
MDLVLTFDFGMMREINSSKGMSEYIDHIVNPEIMEKYNYKTYAFFSNWYFNKDNEDIFSYKNINIGNAFRIAIWNDITYRVRLLVNLLAVKKLQYEKMLIGIEDKATHEVINFLDMKTQEWAPETEQMRPEYFFPIFRWMDEKIYPSGYKETLKKIFTVLLEGCKTVGEKIGLAKNAETDIFVHHYHPTVGIIERLNNSREINVILEKFTWGKNILRGKRLPVAGSLKKCEQLSEKMISRFNDQKVSTFLIEGDDASELLYPAILMRVSKLLPHCLRIVDSINRYFAGRKLRLVVSITNIGLTNSLMQNYCREKNVPIYIIINGLLTYAFLDDAKDATWINSYGESIKKHYFSGMDNIVCLGDPRMDRYAKNENELKINYKKPTIVVGAAGFDNVDLNSYLAYEFEFLNDIMKACECLKERGREMDLIIKVRPNGYIQQYRDFVEEYYPDMPVRLFDSIPMKQVYSKADLYISIYSQTLFEASCLGIPVLYYKKDTQYLHPPFDGKSELVTAFTTDDLIKKIEAFYNRDKIYDSFKDVEVMGKYIGPLDGKNLDRNMDFIHAIISGDVKRGGQTSIH